MRELMTLVRGVSYEKSEVRTETEVGYEPLLRATNIGKCLNFDELVYVPSSRVSADQMLQQYDIVIAASSGSKSIVGKAAQLLTEWSGSFGAFCTVARPNSNVFPKYLGYFFQSPEYRTIVSRLAAGSNINNLKRSHLEGIEVPIPPRYIQEKIVETLDEVLPDVDAGVANLLRAKSNILRYRASLLKSAVDGRLTATWRYHNSSSETGAELLTHALCERRAMWEAYQLAQFEEKGKTPSKDWQKKYVEPTTPDVGSLPKLPDGWLWASMEQFAFDITVGHVGSMKDEYVESGVPFLRSQNVRPLRFSKEGLKYVSEEFHKKLSKSSLTGGELLVVRSGNIGEACVYPKGEPKANCSDLVIARLVNRLDADYAALFVNSPIGRLRVLGKQTGSALPHFNVGALTKSLIPIPPSAEQKEITKIVSNAMTEVGRIELELDVQLRRAKLLRQGILKSIFEGKNITKQASALAA